jgi:membrane protease YdiL (CAAX protease family)
MGRIEEQGGIAAAAFNQFMPMLLIGLVWGYYYLKTDSLWMSWVVHLLNTPVFNLLHITTVDGLGSGIGIYGPVCMVVFWAISWLCLVV